MTKISKFTDLINEIREIALAAYNKRPVEDKRIYAASDNIKAYLDYWKNSFIKLGCDTDAKEIDPWLNTDYTTFLTVSSLEEIHRFIRWFDEEEILFFDMKRYLENRVRSNKKGRQKNEYYFNKVPDCH